MPQGVGVQVPPSALTLPRRPIYFRTRGQAMKQSLPRRLMVGHQPLELSIVVRIHAGQQIKNMKREKFPFKEEPTLDSYVKKISHKRRYWDRRFCEDPKAIEARECILELKNDGESYRSLSEKIGGIGQSVLGRVAGGTAGIIPREEFDGLSTTEYVLKGLKDLIERKRSSL